LPEQTRESASVAYGGFRDAEDGQEPAWIADEAEKATGTQKEPVAPEL
jgi:hypothetical protein